MHMQSAIAVLLLPPGQPPQVEVLAQRTAAAGSSQRVVASWAWSRRSLRALALSALVHLKARRECDGSSLFAPVWVSLPQRHRRLQC